MEAVWGQGQHVQALYPSINICVSGREAVMRSWRVILASMRSRAFHVDLQDVRWAIDCMGVIVPLTLTGWVSRSPGVVLLTVVSCGHPCECGVGHSSKPKGVLLLLLLLGVPVLEDLRSF